MDRWQGSFRAGQLPWPLRNKNLGVAIALSIELAVAVSRNAKRNVSTQNRPSRFRCSVTVCGLRLARLGMSDRDSAKDDGSYRKFRLWRSSAITELKEQISIGKSRLDRWCRPMHDKHDKQPHPGQPEHPNWRLNLDSVSAPHQKQKSTALKLQKIQMFPTSFTFRGRRRAGLG